MATLHLAPVLLPLVPLGLFGVGMASWLDGEDDGEQEADADEFGMEDDFEVDEFDDDFGGMDDMEGGEASSAELEGRIEDLENEIANVSSTANTVRSENEQISEKVDEVEENVRKLLEIYEMVTRGVNPFVDDVSGDMGMGGGEGGGFGLFEDSDTEADAETDEALDDDLASAEAEDFFDDDAFDEFDEEGGGSDPGEEMEDFDVEGEEETDGESSGGTSFEELKAEYESGDADWADGSDTEEEFEGSKSLDHEEEGGAETEEALFEEDDLLEDELSEGGEAVAEAEGDAGDEPVEAEAVATEIDEEATRGEESQGSTGTDESERSDDDQTTAKGRTIGGFQFGTAAVPSTEEGPYLSQPPKGYLADVVILEWMDFLLSEFDARNTVRSINYYHRIGWIGDEMRAHLLTVLMGLTESDYLYREEFGTTELSMGDHMRSLEYIEELSSGNLDRQIADRLETLSR